MGADLRSADLRDAVLIEADLRRVRLDGADLTSADLRRARLGGASLAGAHTAGARWDGAEHDDWTVWPEGVEPDGLPLRLAPIIEVPMPVGAERGLEAAERSILARRRGRKAEADTLERAAVAAWALAFANHPEGKAEALNALARALQTRGLHDAALPVCERAIAAWEEVGAKAASTGWNNLGLSLVELARFAEAEAALARAREIDPASAAPLYWIASLHRRRDGVGDREREIDAWRRYLTAGPTTPERSAEAKARLAELGVEP